MNKTYYAIRTQFYWPSMISDIHGTIIERTTRAQNRLDLHRHTTPLTLFPSSEPGKEILIDILRPLAASKIGNRFILVMNDRFVKVTKCVALKTIPAISMASAVIEHWVSSYGLPDKILFDEGSQFVSNFFLDVMKVLSVETVLSVRQPTTHIPTVKLKGTVVPLLRNCVTM